MIENFRLKRHNRTARQQYEVDDIQWASRVLPNMEPSFLCLCTNRGPLRNPTNAVSLQEGPELLREEPNDPQTQKYEAQTQDRATTVQEKERRRNRILFCLTMTLDATSLMLIRHDSLNSKALGDGRKPGNVSINGSEETIPS